jgi:hypothetical protein
LEASFIGIIREIDPLENEQKKPDQARRAGHEDSIDSKRPGKVKDQEESPRRIGDD